MSYAEERLELFLRLRKQAVGRALPDLFRLDGRSLRFHLGTSMADLRVPVAVDPPLAAALSTAALDLLFLLCARHRTALREAEYDQLLLLDGFDPQAVRPISWNAPAQVSREGVRRAFIEAPELHPALDSGVLAGWISSGRPGRVLVGALNGLFKRAVNEAATDERREPTVWLALLALRGLADTTVASLRRAAVGQPMGRPLTGAVTAGLLVALRLAAREAGVSAAIGGDQAEAAIGPLHWLGGGRTLPSSGVAAYGVSFVEPPPRLDVVVQKLTAGSTPDQLARELIGELIANKDLARKAERAGALGLLRNTLLGLLRTVESGRAPAVALEGMTLAQLYGIPGALERVLASPDRRKELLAKVRSAAKGCTTESARAHVEQLAAAAKDWREEDPAAGWLGAGDAQKVFVQATVALAVDTALERLLDQSERSLLHRSGSESEEGLPAEHEQGKLYLFALGEKPILQVRVRAPQMGHLFCDVKDFTRRTAFLKETVVADFLSREFYTPILTAAARHQHGAVHLGDKGGIYLNNLLGDAVSFSGDVVALVDLAYDIRDALQSYSQRLDSESSREAMARSAADIEERCAARKAVIDAQLERAQAALKKGTLDHDSGEEPGTRIRRLEQELARLAEERESELALVMGEKLEAGIFISFGAAPEVATFEDAVFGAIKVSIAEKINESARGTARNGGVRARVDSLLLQARALSGDEGLTCPFQVLISQPLSIGVSSDLEQAVRAALANQDLESAELVLAGSVRAFVRRLSVEGEQAAGGDIYNGGCALSEEALKAYLLARQGEFMYLRRELSVVSLHPSITRRFVFPQQNLSLVAVVTETSQSLHELYTFTGRALFKGLEKMGGLGVYEMIPRDSPFFALMAEHHIPSWIREHESSDTTELDGWRPTPYIGVAPVPPAGNK